MNSNKTIILTTAFAILPLVAAIALVITNGSVVSERLTTVAQSINRPEAVLPEPIVFAEAPVFYLPEMVIVGQAPQQKKVEPQLVVTSVYACGDFRKEKLVPGMVKECEWVDLTFLEPMEGTVVSSRK